MTKHQKQSIKNLDKICPKIIEQTEWFFGFVLGIITTIVVIVLVKLLFNI